jgi:phosphoenolpyruvate carboxykinase (ATP)
MSASFGLQEQGITVAEIHRSLPLGALYERAVRYEKSASIVDNGSLAAYSGLKTGRSPKDKRIVEKARGTVQREL